jgi:MFS family permease
LHTANPLVDLRLLRRREFASVNVLNFLYGTGVFGMISFVPLYAQEAYGFSASKAGLLLTPRAIAMVLMSILGGLLVNRTGFRLPIVFGLTATTISAGLLSLGQHVASGAGLSDMLYLCLLVSLLGTGLGFAGPSANQAGLDLLPDQVAAVTGLRGMFRALGGAVATAAIGMISSRSSTPGEGLEHSFALLSGLAVLGLVFVSQIPDGPRRLAAQRRKRGARRVQRAGISAADRAAGRLDRPKTPTGVSTVRFGHGEPRGPLITEVDRRASPDV